MRGVQAAGDPKSGVLDRLAKAAAVPAGVRTLAGRIAGGGQAARG